MNIIERDFYARDTVTVARNLLGAILVRTVGDQRLAGIIVETEAYCGADDPASHAYRGKTQRNEAMFGAVGHLYVYFIYGNHFCCNIVAKEPSMPAGAVLIRALQPLDGIEHMSKNRGNKDWKFLTDGPGKLTQALQITKQLNGCDITKPETVYVVHGQAFASRLVMQTPRVGITIGCDKRWRFYLKNSVRVSGSKK